MMTKEEYKENVIRMWDSLREDEYKGNEYCEGVVCDDCPLYKKACGSLYAYEALEIIENWAKEHPIVTNADKFKEMFGFDMTICWDNEFPCNECQFCDIDGTCNSKEKFWNAEYKEPAESEDKE